MVSPPGTILCNARIAAPPTDVAAGPRHRRVTPPNSPAPDACRPARDRHRPDLPRAGGVWFGRALTANQPREAHYALSLIGQLYDVEEEFRKSTADERLAARKERSMPVLDRFKSFLDEQGPGALPKSQYGKAIGYARNQWESLCRYVEDGRLGIDNNISERTLRVAAIGRKNWLFFGSDRGGETAATCLSILASAKRHLIEPFAYVRALLVALAADDVDLESLLPDTWIKAHPEHVVDYRRDEAEAAAKRRSKRRLDRRQKTS